MSERLYAKNGEYIIEPFIEPRVPDHLLFDWFRGKLADPHIQENDLNTAQDCRYISFLLYALARTSHAKSIVEIGVAEGTTTFPLLKAASEVEGGHVHSVDISPLSQYLSSDLVKRNGLMDIWTFHHMGSDDFFAGPGKDLTIDFAFIDGDHSYVGQRNDLENCLQRLIPGGFIVMHDLQIENDNDSEEWLSSLPNDRSPESCPFGVVRACREVLLRYDVDYMPLVWGLGGGEFKEWTEGGSMLIRKRRLGDLGIPHGPSRK